MKRADRHSERVFYGVSRAEIACAALAAVVAHLYCQVSLKTPIIHDAAGYYRISHQILTQGLFSKFELSDLRTYGYPVFLGGLIELAGVLHVSERWLVFEVQLLLHLAGAVAVGAAMKRACARPMIATLVSCTFLLNPFVLIYPGYMLTESLSLSLGMMLFACAVALASGGGRNFLWLAGAGSLLSGFLVEVRPANIFMTPVWALAIIYAVWKRRGRRGLRWQVAGCIVLYVLPLLPQLRNNVVYYGKASPLVATELAQLLRYVGILDIKYATSVIPGQDPSISYINPFHGNEPLTLDGGLRWYGRNPGAGLVTLGLHLFNMLDQDLPFPYVTTLTPAYYPYVSMFNLFVIGLGAAGIAWLAVHWRRLSAAERYVVILAVATIVCHFAVHGLAPAVARFGVAALMYIYPFGVLAGVYLVRGAGFRERATGLSAALAVMAGGILLSGWVRWQAPAIRAAIEWANAERVPLSSHVPTAADAARYPGWDFYNCRMMGNGVIVLVTADGNQVSLAEEKVRLERSAAYRADFEMRSPARAASQLRVGLYGGPAYDRGEQNSVVTADSNVFRHVTLTWNSGPDAPAEGLLRFISFSKYPIMIRNVAFAKLSGGDK